MSGFGSRRQRGAVAAALVAAALVTTLSANEQDRQHGRLFPPEELGVLEGPDRDAWQMPEAVMDALGIADGRTVADIGAGGGWFTVRLARRVGPNGLVYAQDVQTQMLEAIRRRVDREGFANVRTIRGHAADPRLPHDSVDAALLVDAYHEFGRELHRPGALDDEQRAARVAILRGVAAALRPGGRLGVIEFTKAGGGPGPPPEERVDETRVIEEARQAGLRLLRRETFLPFQYFLIFGRAEVESTATAESR